MSNFSRWTAGALAEEIAARGLPKRGRKDELIERLEKDEKRKSKKRKIPPHEELLSSLECPVCMDRMMLPIDQCSSGHIICNVCKPTLVQNGNRCPTCRVSLSSLSRNLMMEILVGGLTVPCSNECGEMHLPYCESREHERRTCPLAPLKCPHVRIAWWGGTANLKRCDFQGSHADMVAHCLEQHDMKRHRGSWKVVSCCVLLTILLL